MLLRGSNEIFLEYQEYYDLYHQKGGNIKPRSCITEEGEKILYSGPDGRNDDSNLCLKRTACTEEKPAEKKRKSVSADHTTFLDDSVTLQREQLDLMKQMVEQMKLQTSAFCAILKELQNIKGSLPVFVVQNEEHD